MSDQIPTKSQARSRAFARRQAVHSDEKGRKGCEKLIEFLSDHKGQILSGYMSIRTEIDPLPAMIDYARDGRVGVPIVLGKDMALEFHEWHPQMEMKPGAYGAQVPVQVNIIVPSVVIVPLAAFDSRGHRLGYGGGYYDRTLAKLRQTGDVLAVGFAYAEQQTDALPTDTTDQPLDAIVTDKTVFTFPR